MITVNVKQLFEAIEEADVFSLPEMNTGTEYLYNNIYSHLFNGNDVTLSSLNFDAFASEDIDSLNGLHTDIFERNTYAANGIISTLRNTTPVSKSMVYV